MAGKGYPTGALVPGSPVVVQIGDKVVIVNPGVGYPTFGPKITPVKVPKYPWRPPGVFPQPKRWPNKTFGTRPLVVYPDHFGPSRFPRINPWWVVGLAPMVAGYFYKSPSPDFAAMGFEKCWDGGGKKEAWSGIYLDNCAAADFWKNLSFQVPGGDMADTPSNVNYGFAVGPYDNPEKTRMTYKELWARPYYNSNPFIMNPPAVGMPNPAFPFADPDPNAWTPFQWEPLFPPVPVYPPRPSPRPRTYPAPVTGPSPVPVTNPYPLTEPNAPPVEVPLTPTAPFNPTPWTPPRPPRGPTTERKYGVGKGSFMAWLLKLAAGTYGGITEMFDLVSAIYKALPPEFIARQPDNLSGDELLSHMMGAIWQQRANLDFKEAIHNIAVNQIEDAAWGRYFALVDKVNRSGTNYGGFDREFGYLNEVLQEVMGAT